MNRQTSVSDFIANISGDKDVGESSRNHGDVSNSMLLDSGSLSIGALGEDDDYFQNAFGVFSSFQTHPLIQDPRSIEFTKEIALEADKAESSERKRKFYELENWNCVDEEIAGASQELKRKQNEQPKQKRCGKMHTMSERRRRERIRGKIRALKELIPNCNKWDKASILDDAINYLKSLKLQVEMLSMGRGAFFQVPYMSTAGIQNPQIEQFSPFMQMRPGMGIGMDLRTGMVGNGMCFSTGLPTMPAPMAAFLSPLSVAAGLPLMSGTRNLPVPQLQMPFIHSQLPVPAATPTMLPNFLTGFSPAFSYSSQGESSSQNIPSSSIDCQQMPITSQSNTRDPQMQQTEFQMPRF